MNHRKYITPDIDKYVKIPVKDRPYKRISEQIFRKLLVDHKMIVTGDNNWFDYDFHPFGFTESILHRQYLNDLRGFKFDFENNVTHEKESPYTEKILGLHTLPNGLTYLGVASCGDLEVPVFHIVYWDGERMRAYVPIYGNIIKRVSKSTFDDREELNETEYERLKKIYNLDITIGDVCKLEETEATIYHILHDESKILWELQQVFYDLEEKSIEGEERRYIPSKIGLYHGNPIEESQCDVLLKLETLLGKMIPIVWNFNLNTFGIRIDNMRVIFLGLYRQKLVNIPENIGKLKDLLILQLASNKLSSIPKSIGDLEELEELILASNQIQSIPLEVCHLESLKKMNLSINKIDSFIESSEDEINPLQSLINLNLSNNRLHQVPSVLHSLKNLIEIDLSNNSTDDNFRRSLGDYDFSPMNSLKKLDVSQNNLNWIPESIQHLTSLGYFGFYGNNLESLPDWIGNLENLEILLLNQNKLSRLPSSIINLKKLKILRLNDNQIEFIPETVKSWLKWLKSQGCEITIDVNLDF